MISLLLAFTQFTLQSLLIKSDCILHTMALISPRLTISEGSTVGIGSVVIKDVSAHTTVFGNPAREIFKSYSTDN